MWNDSIPRSFTEAFFKSKTLVILPRCMIFCSYWPLILSLPFKFQYSSIHQFANDNRLSSNTINSSSVYSKLFFYSNEIINSNKKPVTTLHLKSRSKITLHPIIINYEQWLRWYFNFPCFKLRGRLYFYHAEITVLIILFWDRRTSRRVINTTVVVPSMVTQGGSSCGDVMNRVDETATKHRVHGNNSDAHSYTSIDLLGDPIWCNGII